MGASIGDYLRNTDRRNLFDEWPGKDGKGDAWDAKEAKRRASVLKDRLVGRRVLFVGRRAAAAFGLRDLPWLTWKSVSRGTKVAAIPHPSGIVLWWNDRENRRAARSFLNGILSEDVG